MAALPDDGYCSEEDADYMPSEESGGGEAAVAAGGSSASTSKSSKSRKRRREDTEDPAHLSKETQRMIAEMKQEKKRRRRLKKEAAEAAKRAHVDSLWQQLNAPSRDTPADAAVPMDTATETATSAPVKEVAEKVAMPETTVRELTTLRGATYVVRKAPRGAPIRIRVHGAAPAAADDTLSAAARPVEGQGEAQRVLVSAVTALTAEEEAELREQWTQWKRGQAWWRAEKERRNAPTVEVGGDVCHAPLFSAALSATGPGPGPAPATSASAAAAAAAASASGEAGDQGDEGNEPVPPGKVAIVEEYDFAGQLVKIRRLVDKDSRAAQAYLAKKKDRMALLVDKLKAKKRLTVGDKTEVDWTKFKKQEGITEDLDRGTRGKDAYLEKQDFLQRADWRRFELEKKEREAIRRARERGRA